MYMYNVYMLAWITTAAIQGRPRKKKRKQPCSFVRKEKEGSEGGRTLPTLIGKYQIFSSEPENKKRSFLTHVQINQFFPYSIH
jgi:hypothetical protein